MHCSRVQVAIFDRLTSACAFRVHHWEVRQGLAPESKGVPIVH